MDIGPEAIRKYRAAHGLSQEGLARLLHCSWTTVSAWEAGRRVPTGLYREALEQLLSKKG